MFIFGIIQRISLAETTLFKKDIERQEYVLYYVMFKLHMPQRKRQRIVKGGYPRSNYQIQLCLGIYNL